MFAKSQSQAGLASLLAATLLLSCYVESKSIYVRLLDDDSFPVVVKIKENYSKVNSRTPSNLVTEGKVEVSSQSGEEAGVTDLPTPVEEDVQLVRKVEEKHQASSYSESNGDLETSSSKSVSGELPEVLMRLKMEAIMRKEEELNDQRNRLLLETMAINHLNAIYRGYVVQDRPSK